MAAITDDNCRFLRFFAPFGGYEVLYPARKS